MMAGSLRSDLLDIPGIESAEIEGDVLTPAGVKVRLAPGADAAAVSEQVQRVLAAHGLSSELSGEDGAEAPVAAQGRILAAAPEPEPEVVEATFGEDQGDEVGGEVMDEDAAMADAVPEEATGAGDGPALVIERGSRTVIRGRVLASIAVEEDRNGVSVLASAEDGETAARRSRPEGRGLEEAVVAAVTALYDPGLPVPVVVSIADQVVDGSAILTVVLDLAERRLVGSTIVEGGRPYAVGRATWAALSAR